MDQRQQFQQQLANGNITMLGISVAQLTLKALPAELEMSRDLETVMLHPNRPVTYQKKHQLKIQDLPLTDRKRQGELLKKIGSKVNADDPITRIALEVLQINQVGMIGIKSAIDRDIKTAFCQSIKFCPPDDCKACINIYLGGVELACIPNCLICYYKCCKAHVKTSTKYSFAEIPEEPLPKLYLIDVSVLKKYEGESMPSFETLREKDLLSVYNFDRCPVFTFVSHKWVGNSPDDSSNSLFKEIKSTMSGYVWVDYMCVPQAGSFDVRLPFLKSIPYVIISSTKVFTPTKGNEYRRSVWCNMEQFLEMDEGLALVEEFRIQKAEDLAPIIVGLKEVLFLLLIHSPQYQQFVGKFVLDDAMGGQAGAMCNPLVCGASKFLIFDHPEMHMLNPTLARICEYYLIHKYSL